MWTDEDVLKTRWQRWHARVMALNLDALLRWTLVATAGSLAVFSALAVLGALGQAVMATVTFAAGLVR